MKYAAWATTRHVFGNLRDKLSVDPPGCISCITIGKGEATTTTSNGHAPLGRTELKLGDMIPMEEGLVGVVLARYTRSDDVRNDEEKA